MEYDFRKIEPHWQAEWKKKGAYKVSNDSPKPKYYVLDMFPYPSGTGLHVGHPLGYIASDIFSRFKRLKGFNVLHPMGFDSFGLPAEQYALETGQHPATTTEKNISTFNNGAIFPTLAPLLPFCIGFSNSSASTLELSRNSCGGYSV